MAVKERKQITGTTEQINAFAGHEGVLAFDTTTKHLKVLSGVAGTQTELANTKDLTQGLNTKLGKTEKASSATVADTANAVAWNNVTGKPDASENAKGIVQLANTEDITTGTNTTKAVTPKQLKDSLETAGVASLPLGHMFWWYGKTAPDGALICNNGALYDKETYKDLFAYLQKQGVVIPEAEWQAKAKQQNNYCASFSDNGTTFRAPSLAPFVRLAYNPEKNGEYWPARLPNITGDISSSASGYIGGIQGHSPTFTGAFDKSIKTDKAASWQGETPNGMFHLMFNASRSNPIYGKTVTVQPESMNFILCIQAVGKATNIGSADISAVMKSFVEIQERLSRVENNPPPTPKAYITKTWRAGDSWYREWSDGWRDQGGYVKSSQTVTLPTSFTDKQYNIVISNSPANDTWNSGVSSLTTTSFSIYLANNRGAFWRACGY